MSDLAPDRLFLDVPDSARAAHARVLGLDPAVAGPFAVGGTSVYVGLGDRVDKPGLLLGVPDVAEAARVAIRRGIELGAEADGARHLVVHGLTLGYAGPEVLARGPAVGEPPEIDAVDHIVLTSPNRDRTLATFCARLGFDVRLDRVQPWGVHQLFLRRGAMLVEVVVQDDADPGGDDALWGVAWRTTDIDRTYARLTSAGVVVSEVRRGHKPGTRVATVKDPALGIPTIVIEQGERAF